MALAPAGPELLELGLVRRIGKCQPSRVAAVALVFERFRGRRFSSGAYEKAREAMGIDLPTYDMVRRSITGGKKQGAWDNIRAAAIQLILSKPAKYPKAYAYLTRAAAVAA